jgi:riboflavin biosynthesis pyrimidine reductase
VRRLLPDTANDVDVHDAYADPARRGGAGSRPWVLVNMVSSVDGSVTTEDGVSGGLGGPGDKAVFRALRALADVVLVGAGTVRAERYRPRPGVRLAVVTASAELDWTWPLWTDPGTTVVTTNAAVVPDGVRVIRAGNGQVDLAAALQALGEVGHGVVLCEGGPSLNGQLLAAGLIDEVCLTLAPRLVAGDGMRVAKGPWAPSETWRLVHVLAEDDELFLRYRISRSA